MLSRDFALYLRPSPARRALSVLSRSGSGTGNIVKPVTTNLSPLMKSQSALIVPAEELPHHGGAITRHSLQVARHHHSQPLTSVYQWGEEVGEREVGLHPSAPSLASLTEGGSGGGGSRRSGSHSPWFRPRSSQAQATVPSSKWSQVPAPCQSQGPYVACSCDRLVPLCLPLQGPRVASAHEPGPDVLVCAPC